MEKHISEMAAYDVMVACACNHRHIVALGHDDAYEQYIDVIFEDPKEGEAGRRVYAGRYFRVWKHGKLEER